MRRTLRRLSSEIRLTSAQSRMFRGVHRLSPSRMRPSALYMDSPNQADSLAQIGAMAAFEELAATFWVAFPAPRSECQLSPGADEQIRQNALISWAATGQKRPPKPQLTDPIERGPARRPLEDIDQAAILPSSPRARSRIDRASANRKRPGFL
jgi:hypothetical protein